MQHSETSLVDWFSLDPRGDQRMRYVTTSHKWLNIPDDVIGRYNAWDTYATAKVATRLRQELSNNGQLEYFNQWFKDMTPVAHAMWVRGAGRLDSEAKAKYRRSLRAELRETEAAIDLRCGATSAATAYTDKFFNSSQQKASYLFDQLALRPAPVTRDRIRRSTDQSALIYILNRLRVGDEQHRSTLHNFFHRSRLNTIDTRYLTVEEDLGRVRPTIKLYGAKTGRLAYAEPPLQQWPVECRHILVPEEGHTFVVADYSQLEARILAYLSGDIPSIETFRAGNDLHKQNALDLFGYTEEQYLGLDLAQRVAARNFAKGFVYGLSYGGSAETMKSKLFCPCPRCTSKAPPELNLSRTELRMAQDRWEYKHQAVVKWRDQLVKDTLHSGRSYTSPFGYRRLFFTPYPKLQNELLNFPMQHCAAKIVERAMITLHESGLPLVLQMHDSLMLEVPNNQVFEATSELVSAMEAPIPELGGVSFPVDVKVGPNWGDMAKWQPGHQNAN